MISSVKVVSLNPKKMAKSLRFSDLLYVLRKRLLYLSLLFYFHFFFLSVFPSFSASLCSLKYEHGVDNVL